MIKKIFSILVLIYSTSYANEVGVDCLVLQDENSIICKYTHDRDIEDTQIKVIWIDPNGNISREREMIIPAGHGSVYDFRYISGRILGTWTFQVNDSNAIYKTNFILK